MKTTRVPWNRDEILVVAAIGIKYGWPNTPPHSEMEKLSSLLRRCAVHPEIELGEENTKFRNVNGVERKYYDLLTARPGYPGNATNGGITTLSIVEYMIEHQIEVFEAGIKIRQMLESDTYRSFVIPGLRV